MSCPFGGVTDRESFPLQRGLTLVSIFIGTADYVLYLTWRETGMMALDRHQAPGHRLNQALRPQAYSNSGVGNYPATAWRNVIERLRVLVRLRLGESLGGGCLP